LLLDLFPERKEERTAAPSSDSDSVESQKGEKRLGTLSRNHILFLREKEKKKRDLPALAKKGSGRRSSLRREEEKDRFT